MRKVAEWLYQKVIILSKFAIIAYCAFVLITYSRGLHGSNLETAAQSYIMVGFLLICLLGIRHCVIQIVSILAPFTIDGDKLLQDYDISSTIHHEGEFKNLELKPNIKSGHTVTLSIAKNHSVPLVSTSDEQLLNRLPSMGWNIETTSKMKPEELCYVFKLNKQLYFLSEDQTIDLFCYIMADHRRIEGAEEIDDEIEKYCSGLGLVRNPG